MKTLVIIPTYNESENIRAMVPALYKQAPEVDVLVVDDNSPDGTSQVVKEMSKEYPHVHLLFREKKEGLGRAYLAGFNWGLEHGYEALVEMDADFSHRPEDLPFLLEKLEDCDAVVGSRWVPGGRTVNWGWGRQAISRGGSFYARCILGYSVRDWTGGFNAWRREVLQGISLSTIQSEGYSFQIELKYRALRKGFQVEECPITFEERRLGQSKMSSKIVLEALYRVWTIKLSENAKN
jgi:dolichol-phosphate mannosyltransferase